MTDFVIRPARPGEADELGALAMRSKAYWGYDEAFMEACREELTIPAEKVVGMRTYVAVAIPSAAVDADVDVDVEGDAEGTGGTRGRDGAGGADGGEFAAGRILGFGTVEGEPPAGELGMLFIDPPAIGQGVGSALLSYLAAIATDLGFHRLTIAADPNAEPFYLAKGAVRIGGVPSGSVPGRVLPLLALAL